LKKTSIAELNDILKNCTYEEYVELKTELSGDTRKNIINLLEKTGRRFDNFHKMIEEYNNRRKYEAELLSRNVKYIAGIDEVGRGPLAGPVYAAAVILDLDNDIYGIKDSKKLAEEQRNKLSQEIIHKCISYSIGFATVDEIDKYNILNATKLAMRRAIKGLKVEPEHILIDALKLEGINIPQTPIIKGDDLSVSIGAASIIAKVERDGVMDDIGEKYPQYLFGKNKGYGTKEHIEAIQKHGICEHHRRTFVKNFI
jgi:ribonuclease HII